MRSRLFACLLAILCTPAFTQQADSPRTDYRPGPAPAWKDLLIMASGQNVTLQKQTAADLNRVGFAFYERTLYPQAAQFFRAAASQDPTYVVAHINLACVLSLDGDGLGAAGVNELLYHLHRSIELDPTRLAKIKADPDLVEARKLPQVRALIDAYEKPGSWSWDGTTLYRQTGPTRFLIDRGVRPDQDPFYAGVGIVAVEDPRKMWMAYLADVDGMYAVRVTTRAGRVHQLGDAFDSLPPVLYEKINMLFSPDGRKLVAGTGKGLVMLDLLTDRERQVSETPEAMIDIPLAWDGAGVRFKRGTLFEMSFAGKEWHWDETRGTASEVPNGEVWAGEDMRGESAP